MAESIETDIPARLDRLAWGKWHWLVVMALGITWILDGLEVTVVGSVGSVLEEHETLSLSASDVGLAGTAYIAGAIIGRCSSDTSRIFTDESGSSSRRCSSMRRRARRPRYR